MYLCTERTRLSMWDMWEYRNILTITIGRSYIFKYTVPTIK